MDTFDQELLSAAGQRSEVWFDARLGKFTASEIWKIMNKGRAKDAVFSETGLKYISQKVAEDLTGHAHSTPYAAALEYGQEMEVVARQAYESRYGCIIEEASFVDFHGIAGGSPDGFMPGGIIEIKCPFQSDNQISYLQLKSQEDLKDQYPEYYWQIQANLLFTTKESCDFITFDPRMKNEKHKMFVLTVSANYTDQTLIVERIHLAQEKKLEILNSI